MSAYTFNARLFLKKTETEKCPLVAYLTVREHRYNFIILSIICTFFLLAAMYIRSIHTYIRTYSTYVHAYVSLRQY